MKQKQKDGYEFEVEENQHHIFIRKDGEYVGMVSPKELKNLGVIEE